MRNFVALALLAVSAAAHAEVPPVNLTSSNPVVGIAVTESVQSRPDVAIVSVGVTASDPKAANALSQTAVKMKQVIDRLRAFGIAEKDIQTTGIDLEPNYNDDEDDDASEEERKIIGYTASNDLRVRYGRVNEVGKLLDALVAAGANSIDGPYFESSNAAVLRGQAWDKALLSAELRAREYARRNGARGIKLLSITEGTFSGYGGEIVVTGSGSSDGPPPPPPPPSPTEAGEIKTSISLFVQYALEP
ncbi:MAG TPA: SIMPL domain-containing protein [Allosphingosinicella sp.]|uniref:SIMPL domain-containing protein n=1 Tax=Allosphingosinicella sp. TaxID=2823234 RepID=UPI002ED86027